MFQLEEVFSKRNQLKALSHFDSKPNHLGKDGLLLSDLREYWGLNGSSVVDRVSKGRYTPSLVYQTDMLKKTGGRRKISSYGNLDRFLLRLLSQKLERYIGEIFSPNSMAYQVNKGVMPAIYLARDFMNQGFQYLVEIDLHHYFDTIDLDLLMQQLGKLLTDQRLLAFINLYLRGLVSYQGQVVENHRGIIQGCSISPVLSNLYLNDLDHALDERGLAWFRYADNIYIFCRDKRVAIQLYEELTERLVSEFRLEINRSKSGVFKAIDRRILGYDFFLRDGAIECLKHRTTSLTKYSRWHDSQLCYANKQYYIVEIGILNQKDYSLLFENEDYKHCLPVQSVEQINVYSNVVIAPQALSLLTRYRIPLILHNHVGDIESYFIPESMRSLAPTVLKQCELYLDEGKRLAVAKRFELAHLHNLRANCRYYLKRHKGNEVLLGLEEQLTTLMNEVKAGKSVNELMLIEARAKQNYYQLFNVVINQEGFAFEKRTKRPPRDALNALISFCNTVLYSQVLRMIWKSRLDPKISVLHASTNRPYSLHLDFADYMKPVIVDRVILSLINRHQIDAVEHFETQENGAVWLNQEGKRLVLQKLEEKLTTRLVINNTTYTYLQLIGRDVGLFKKYVMLDPAVKTFRPYKYY